LSAAPKAAFREHLQPYRLVLLCVSRDASVLHQPDFLQGGAEATIAVRPNPLVLATTTGTRLLLHLKFRAQLDASRQQARCSHYHMQVADADDRELVTFHSGHGEPRNNFPHVHVAMPRTLVHKKHLPTGEEDVKLAYVIKPYPHDQARLTPSQTSGLGGRTLAPTAPRRPTSRGHAAAPSARVGAGIPARTGTCRGRCRTQARCQYGQPLGAGVTERVGAEAFPADAPDGTTLAADPP